MDKNKKFKWSGIVNPTSYQKTQRNLLIVIAVLVVLLLAVLAYLGWMLLGPYGEFLSAPPTEPSTPVETRPRPTIPEGLVMLDHLTEWYEQNNALAGWLRIEGTQIDYPVIHTPEDPDKYLRKDFNGKFSMEGTLFIEGNCSTMPESDNTIIYGHNMKRGTMFHDLMNYKKQSYWEEHPIIEYSTLYEERQYEIIAAFYDKVYYSHEDVFKFYQFIDYETEGEFQEAMDYYRSKAEYETGVEPQYGDRLLTLVTCSYHVRYGRFVVVAREIPAGTEAPAESLPELPQESTSPAA